MPNPKRPALATVAAPPTRADVTRPSDALEGAKRLPLALLDPNPWQPRQDVEGTDLEGLAADIAAHGIIQPLTVRPVGDRYEIVAGERRYRAAGRAGLTHVPVIIQNLSDADARALAIRENIHRADMDPEELGRYFLSLQEAGASLRDIGAAIGKSHMYVQRYIRLAQDPVLLAAYRAGQVNLDDVGRGEERVVPEPADDRNNLLQAPAPPTPSVADDDARNNLLQATDAANTAVASPFRRQPTIFKPFHSFRRDLQRMNPATVEPELRSDLAATIDSLIEELQTIKAGLSQD